MSRPPARRPGGIIRRANVRSGRSHPYSFRSKPEWLNGKATAL